jgi:phosphatase NudJ
MPNQWKPSITVAAVVQNEGRFLLVEETTTDGIKLNQPAGHLDPGETPASGALREALEESGWALETVGLLGIYLNRYISSRTQEDVTYLRFAFACRVLNQVENSQLDEGIIRTLWLTPEEIKATEAQHRSPLVLRCVEDYLAWQRRERPLTPLEHVFTHDSVILGPQAAGQF